jgi:ribonuclease BN (tRNA processing enzyme)
MAATKAESTRPIEAAPSLRLTIVGCAAAWSTRPGRASSCYLVEIGDDALVLDMGQGSFSLLAARRDPGSLRAVLISHLHADHCIDLIPLRHYLKYAAPRGAARTSGGASGGAKPSTGAIADPHHEQPEEHPRQEDPHGARLELHGPVDLPARFDDFARETHLLAPLAFHPLVSGPLRLGPFDITVGRVTHAERSFAFRVAPARRAGERRGPPGLVYSGDCGDPADLVPLVRPGDTLLAEAYWGAGPWVPEAHHMDAAGAARAASEGGAARLVLTHLQDGFSAAAARRAARAVFVGEIVVAKPGLVVEVRSGR